MEGGAASVLRMYAALHPTLHYCLCEVEYTCRLVEGSRMVDCCVRIFDSLSKYTAQVLDKQYLVSFLDIINTLQAWCTGVLFSTPRLQLNSLDDILRRPSCIQQDRGSNDCAFFTAGFHKLRLRDTAIDSFSKRSLLSSIDVRDSFLFRGGASGLRVKQEQDKMEDEVRQSDSDSDLAK